MCEREKEREREREDFAARSEALTSLMPFIEKGEYDVDDDNDVDGNGSVGRVHRDGREQTSLAGPMQVVTRIAQQRKTKLFR